MIGITALGVYLLLLFSLLTLALFLSLLCLARWRRRFGLTESVSETSTEPYKSPSKELIYYLCWKNQSRIEPAGTPAAPPETGSDAAEEEFDKLYGRSRVLYTIKEEKETEVEEEENSVEGAEEEFELLEEGIENDPQNFYSPLSSPQFYTPYSSPSRAGATTSPEREAAAGAQASEPPDVLV